MDRHSNITNKTIAVSSLLSLLLLLTLTLTLLSRINASIDNVATLSAVDALPLLSTTEAVNTSRLYSDIADYGILAQYSSGDSSEFNAFFIGFLVVILALSVLMLISMWMVFERAGRPGWASIIPIYNVWVIAEIGGKPGWMGLVAAFVNAIPLVGPIISLVLWIMIYIGVANSFGRGTGFGFGLAFLPFIFFPILAFAKDTVLIPPMTPTPAV